ncbi:hypothetical protein MAFF211271_31100 [Ralstonia syzygii subsp. indonesiensis]|nr:hypothetical protein MAFF211271_31100 [Ralstonia pseudosolanacearum]
MQQLAQVAGQRTIVRDAVRQRGARVQQHGAQGAARFDRCGRMGPVVRVAEGWHGIISAP